MSTRRYSVMATESERFQQPLDKDVHLQEALAAVDYDTDRGDKATISTRLKQDRNQFKIVFDNTTPR